MRKIIAFIKKTDDAYETWITLQSYVEEKIDDEDE